MNKLKDVAGLLKAKITKDQLEEALINATSQQNWQASTHILHEIANAAYNYEKWQQINEFIWQKLKKGKSWRKILKTLNLVEFLLKNGPPSIISSFKYDIYQFRSFDNFSHYDDGIDRGESIRERAKAVVDLLSNEELLQEERVKAKTIRQRMSGVVTGSNYGGFNNKESSSIGGGKYGSIDNKSYQSGGYSGSSSSTQPGYGDSGLGVYGDYSYQKSTLDKYKDTKPAAKKQTTTTQSLTTPLVQDKKQPIIDNKKPFERIAPKLVKPGTKPVSKPEPVNNTKPQSGSGNNNIIGDDIFGTTTEVQHVQKVEQPPQQYVQPVQQPVQQTVQQPVQQSSPFDLGFSFDTPTTKPQVQQPVVQQPVQQPLIQPQQSFHTPVQQPSLYQQPTQNTFGLNLTQPTYGQQPQYPTQSQYGGYPQPQPYQQPNQFNMMGGYQQPQQGLYGYNPQPQQPFNAYNQPYQQPGHFPQQQPQTWAQQQPLTLSTPTPPQNLGPISLQTTTTHSKKDEDEFGNFSSGQNNNVKWLTSQEKGLIDFSDFGDELKNGGKKQQQQQQGGNNIDTTWTW